jgi:phage tail-like protein
MRVVTISASAVGGSRDDSIRTAQGAPQQALPELLGLAMWFRISIDGLDLGYWQSCRGLGAKFNPMPLRVTGDYVGQYYLPGDVGYNVISLERAVHKASSDRLQAWLIKVMDSWKDGTGDETRGTAKITLLDAEGKEAGSWLLYGVRPSSWSGPDLSTSAAKVAVERLELVHEGFFDLALPSKTASLKGPEGREVQFPYNPTKLMISRTSDKASTSQGSTSGGNATEVGAKVSLESDEALKIKTGDMILVGSGVSRDIGLLIEFSAKVKDKGKDVSGLPLLVFGWGDMAVQVQLLTLAAEITRFDCEARPVQAKVGLDLIVVNGTVFADQRPPRNRVVQNSPDQWRSAAKAKGVDDPMRAGAGRR